MSVPAADATDVLYPDDISVTSAASVISGAYSTSRRLQKRKSRIQQKSLVDYQPWPDNKKVDFVLIYKAKKSAFRKKDSVLAHPRPYDEQDVDSTDYCSQQRNRFHCILRNNGCELEVENFESRGVEYRAVKIHAVPFWMDYWAEKFLLMKPVKPPEGTAHDIMKIKREWHNDFTNEDKQYLEYDESDHESTMWSRMKAHMMFTDPWAGSQNSSDSANSSKKSSPSSVKVECVNEELAPSSDLKRLTQIVSTGRSGGEEDEVKPWEKIRSVVFTEQEQDPLLRLITLYNESAYHVEKTDRAKSEATQSRLPKMLRNAVAAVTDTVLRRNAQQRSESERKKKLYVETDAYKQLAHLNKRHDNLLSVRFVRWLFILIHGHNDRLTLMQDSIRTRAIRAPFTECKKLNFLGYENEDFYTSSERSRMVFRILENAKDMPPHNPHILPLPYGIVDQENGEYEKQKWISKNWTPLGLQEMLAEDCYLEAFPIHAGDYRVGGIKNTWEEIDLEKVDNPRKLLRYFWSSSHMTYKYQPLNVVKNYFGATTAMYFAFVGFYNMWLIGPAIIGFGVFVYGISQISDNEMVQDICGSKQTFLMCPDCDDSTCDTYYLSDYCVTTAVTSAANNGAVVVFSVMMMVWFALFVTMWERRQNTIAHLWGTTHSRDATAELRPKYTQTKTTNIRFNPVSGKQEAYVTFWNRLPQYTVAVAVVITFLSAAILLLLSITIYNFTIYIFLRETQNNSLTHTYAKEISSMITGSCSALVIQLLSLVYSLIAKSLTEWENHRTQRDYENHLTFKLYLFEFVNYYGTLFYISFIKGKFTNPTERKYLFPKWKLLAIEGCAPGGCMSEVAIQMIIIMTVKQCIPIGKKVYKQLNLQKLRVNVWISCCSWFCCVLPRKWVRKARERKDLLSNDDRKQFIKDFELREAPEMYAEYADDIIQIGFLTMFVTAVPFAPIIALVINLWQLRADATRYVKRLKRPVGFRSSGIGSWMKIIEFLCRVAILVNAVLIAFTFDYLPNLLYRYTISGEEGNYSLDGYVDFMMAHHTVNISGVVTPCRYWSYINAASEEKKDFWLYLWILRLGFVFFFQNIVWTIVRIIDVIVPSTPQTVRERVIVETRLAQEWLSDDDSDGEDQPETSFMKKSSSEPSKLQNKWSKVKSNKSQLSEEKDPLLIPATDRSVCPG